MLEQYRHENPQEKDVLSENGFQNPKRKLIFTLTGIALAFLLFLLLMGTFRSDDQTEEQRQLATLEAAPVADSGGTEQEQIINQIKELQARVEKLENSALVLTIANPNPQDEALPPQERQELKEFQLSDAIADEIKPSFEVVQEPPAAKKPQDAPRVYTVQRGDTLSKISLRYFGTTKRWKDIYNANKDKISNINQLKVGTQLTIPEDTKK
jgi:LysM repeat protein